MKMYLDKDYLQKITNGNHDLLISDEQKLAMERISGMITQNMRFCCLMTGYRGTGKSSFIKYLLEKIQEKNSSVSVISFNAAKYQSYDIFIRRFVRELFFQMDKKNLASAQLRKMYYRTFFDVKETYLNHLYDVEAENIERERLEQIHYKKNINITLILGFIFRWGLYLLSLIVVWYGMDLNKYRLIYSLILAVCATFIKALEINYTKESVTKDKHAKNSEEKKVNENKKLVEILYDSEIAEYYVYDELQKINEGHNELIFVLDELDKIEYQELDMIFHDLKPLFLSDNCNFILIAGKNMEKYLYTTQKDTDSIARTLFSHKLYMPLSTIQDMREFAECFYQAKTMNKNREFYSNSDVQNYFNLKIYEAKGVKRAFINGILSDLRWEGNKPYIDLSSNAISREFVVLFSVLEKMEENIYQSHLGPERDELLQLLYGWIERIQQNRNTTFILNDIMGGEEQIIEYPIYTNAAERMNLLYNLMEYMTKSYILEEIDGHFKWCSDITINMKNFRDEIEKDDLSTHKLMKDYVELFQTQWDEIGNILSYFANYNRIIVTIPEVEINQSEKYRILLNEMIPDLRYIYPELDDSLLYLQKLYKDGFEKKDIKYIQTYSRRMVKVKGLLIETLFWFSCKRKMGEENFQVNNSELPVDIVYHDKMSQKAIFIEIKYYKEYLKIVNSSLLYKMVGQILNYINYANIEKYMFKLIIFTDSIDEEDMHRFRQKCNRMLEGFYEKENIQIILVPLNNYKMFEKQLDACIMYNIK